MAHGAMQGFTLGHRSVSWPSVRQPGTLLRSDTGAAARSLAATEQFSTLGKFAFACLWLLVFAMPWEDAITISGFGTSVRLIGVVAVGLGVLAIIERGKVRRPAPGHVILALFVVLAALSYLWSLYPEGTIVEVFSYVQLFTMVWLIWELAPGVPEQMRLMRAYVLGTFVSGIDTLYLFLSHQESAYQRCPASSSTGRSPGVRSSGKRAGRFSARILSSESERMRSGLSSAVFWLNRFVSMNAIQRPLRTIPSCRSLSSKA